MAAFTVTLVQLFAFWERISRLGFRLVVTVTATASASLEILGVVKLVLQGVAFLYVSEKRVVAPMPRVVAAVIGVLNLFRGVVEPEPNLVADSAKFLTMRVASCISKIVNLFHQVLNCKDLFRHVFFHEKV
jgi:hypothetical protein